MFPIRGLVALLDKNEDQVLRLVEDGDLLWAFDLSLIPERARSKELRVLAQCAHDYLAGRKSELEWENVARLVLPHDEPILTSLEIQRSCNVSCAHVTALIRRRQLECVSKGHTGPKGSARVTASSFTNFLERRRFF